MQFSIMVELDFISSRAFNVEKVVLVHSVAKRKPLFKEKFE